MYKDRKLKYDAEELLCTYYTYGKSACEGDFGGLAMYNYNNSMYMVSLVIFILKK